MSMTTQGLKKGSTDIVDRRELTRDAANVNTLVSSGGKKVQIRIDAANDEWLNPTTFFIGHELLGQQTGGSAMTFNDWAASTWMLNVDIKTNSGALIGHSIIDYGAYMRYFYELNTTNEQTQSHLNTLEGALASASSALTAKTYFHKPILHFFGLEDSYIPIGLLGGIIIEITYADPTQVFASYDGTSPKYNVNELRAYYELVKVTEAKHNAVRKSGISINYESVVGQQQSVTTSTSQKFKLGTVSGKIQGTTSFMVRDSDRVAGTTDYWPSFNRNNLGTYRYQLGSEFFGASPIVVSTTNLAEAMVQLIRSLDISPLEYQGNEANKVSTYFTMEQKMNKSKYVEEDSAITNQLNNEVNLSLTFSSAPAAGIMYSFVDSLHELEIKGNSSSNDMARHVVVSKF